MTSGHRRTLTHGPGGPAIRPLAPWAPAGRVGPMKTLLGILPWAVVLGIGIDIVLLVVVLGSPWGPAAI